jgi:prolyl oligopeptidase
MLRLRMADVAQEPRPVAGTADADAELDFLWLEEVDGGRALAWVERENTRTVEELGADPEFSRRVSAALAIADSDDRLPLPLLAGEHVLNFWQDATHVRGLLRRSGLTEFAGGSPTWTTVLDIDALARTEQRDHVFKGANVSPAKTSRALIALSDGGRDAVEIREVDLRDGSAPDRAFVLPAGKQECTWLDVDTLLVAREWQPGEVTTSGYPFVIRQWQRGRALSDAQELFRGAATDVGVSPLVLRSSTGRVARCAVRHLSFFEHELWLLEAGGQRRVALPRRISVHGMHGTELIVGLHESWTTPGGLAVRSGSLLAIDGWQAATVLAALEVRVLFEPTQGEALEGVGLTATHVLAIVNRNIVGSLRAFRRAGDEWQAREVPVASQSTVALAAAAVDVEHAFVLTTGFLAPPTLYRLGPALVASTCLSTAPKFDGRGLAVEQRWVTAADGVRVPYFLVQRDDATADPAPTLLTAYGGFQVSMRPSYAAVTGKLWLERGGRYVVANIRGGGEFGPEWHQAGLRTKRQTVFDDFLAVARDLVSSGITRPDQLGILGGSNGGLLMGVAMTQAPELFRAVLIQVPLLDMLRYHRLLAGASWIAEFGSPDDPDERAFLERISPYHALRADRSYPLPMFVTSTRDDRVHPGHARRMAAKLQRLGKPYYYFENTAGGHAAASDAPALARRLALEFTYFATRLGLRSPGET